MNSNGVKVVSYSYDPWGKPLDTTISTAGSSSECLAWETAAEVNPLRYRGYYYDTETGFYYLQSRYYDPVIGRFINADTFATTNITGLLSSNMFAYCENNPVMGVDVNGRYPAFLERLFDYAAMHIMTQIHCSSERGWKMEQYISGPKGKGRLDLYDSNKNQYYEVKSKGAYNNGLHNSQMAKYDSGIVKSSGLVPTRGTKDLSGSFICGMYDVRYYTPEPGVIVYEHKVNEKRVAMSAVVGICIVLSIVAPEVGIPLIGAIGTFACA